MQAVSMPAGSVKKRRAAAAGILENRFMDMLNDTGKQVLALPR